CHVKPDLVLIYAIKNDYLQLVRIGSHSELFGKRRNK
ncbi:type II toxin-antitoxin system mRNA interferase toxin, RelE/StbE family, partial [Acinetobacter schindleri]